ncbi:MAG: D-tyrosyl-tRNA(Tyr) deacylase [Tidjanibacter sp.]|nr:D-tyrosyl-tRNA(Tyr) deacylase [Tidjanibacter sp.]
MRIVIQRVTSASVAIAGETVGAVGEGMMILVGVENGDTREDADWLVGKTLRLRIFDDEAGVMNRSIEEIGGAALVVSQFTLHASTRKGNRPSYIRAAREEYSRPLYDYFTDSLRNTLGTNRVATGQFGADMQVSLTNNGPVTIIIDSKLRE